MEFDGDLNGVAGSSEFDATAYTLGVGKYLGRATAVDLSVAAADTEGSDTTNIALSFSHIGSIGKDWQYGANIGFARSDQSIVEGSYSLRGSLYPSPEFEFGIGLLRQLYAGGRDQDTVEGYASWFVRDHVQFTARYQQENPEMPGQDADVNQFSIGVNVRF